MPHAVDAALTKSLAPVPADRYATALEFAEALDATAGTSTPATPRAAGRFPVRMAALGLAICIVAAGLFAWRHRVSGVPASTTAGPVGLAVLPFDTEGDTANAYFSDGITDEIRGKLSALPTLQVIARTSSNQYRQTRKPADEIGHELGVQYLLTGTVQWERGLGGMRRVRVSPELIQVAAGRAPVTKWQQSYDTTLADVFDVQTAVATQVADKLGVVLSMPAQTQLAARPTQNIAAYDAYLRSIALEGADLVTTRRALAAAMEAVALDSGFAAAWARIARIDALIYAFSTPTQADVDGAHRAAERAVALAPMAPDGYLARGAYNLYVAHDLEAARVAFETALRLAPSSSEANGELALAEATVGHWAQALDQARRGCLSTHARRARRGGSVPFCSGSAGIRKRAPQPRAGSRFCRPISISLRNAR